MMADVSKHTTLQTSEKGWPATLSTTPGPQLDQPLLREGMDISMEEKEALEESLIMELQSNVENLASQIEMYITEVTMKSRSEGKLLKQYFYTVHVS